MNWRRVSDTCIECGGLRIFRYPLGEPEYFELWNRLVFVGRYASAVEAKQEAGNLSREAA